jgi:hypothetical protein
LALSFLDHLYTLRVRYTTDAIGMLVMAPAALAVLRGDAARLLRSPGVAGRAALLATLIAVSAGVFAQSRYPLLFLVPPR